MKLILMTIILTACNFGIFKKDNEKSSVTTSAMLEEIAVSLDETYCFKGQANYIAKKGRIHECDSALFAGLLGVACPGIDISHFENEPGQMCRTWDCNCYLPDEGINNGSDSQYSKDMNAGISLNIAVNKNQPELTRRIIDRLQTNNLVLCEAIDDVTWLGKCILPPASMQHWIDIEKNMTGVFLTRPRVPLFADYEKHLQVLGAIKEGEIYDAISDVSLINLRVRLDEEPRNVLFMAAHALYTDGDMAEAAAEWLRQCPVNRLPNNHQDWCTGYRYQRGENSTKGDGQKNWDPCPNEPFEEHTGIDCAFSAWVILHNREFE